MPTPKTQFDLHLAAQATAIKNLDVTTERQAALNVLNDFDELKIDDRHFQNFKDIVENRVTVLRNLRQQPLENPAPAAPAAPAAKKPATT
jgi:hypothetical protein